MVTHDVARESGKSFSRDPGSLSYIRLFYSGLLFVFGVGNNRKTFGGQPIRNNLSLVNGFVYTSGIKIPQAKS
jgi:hypothetical protein